MFGLKNERFSESEISEIGPTKKPKENKDLIRKKKPVQKEVLKK